MSYVKIVSMKYYLIAVVIGLLFLGSTFIVELFVVPHLNEDSKFLKFWRDHVIGEDPYEK
jgi:hypothetical protein